MLAVTITTAANTTPRAVVVFIDQAARAPEGISTPSIYESCHWQVS
jgi:hypothetical protein